MAIGAANPSSFFESGPRTLAAGVVAFNEETRLRSSVESLTGQELPHGVRWGEIWVVASGCTDRTVEVAKSLAQEDPRVRLVVERERRGKARALREVFDRAHGDALVLLNSDARAEPRAVEQLLRTASGKSPPFAVMARPVVPHPANGRWAPTFRWLWDLHHEYHAELLSEGGGGHLSDELLLVSLPSVPPIPDGIINDGSYLAVWLAQHAGGRWYAADARVSIDIPVSVRDHLHQRRRIHVGNAQVATVLEEPPTTLPRQFLRHPSETVRLLRYMLARDGGVGHFARVASWELASHALAAWDRLPPRRDHVRWQRIRSPSPGSVPSYPATASDPVPVLSERPEERVASLLRVAENFDTGLSLGQLRKLLPRGSPESVEEIGLWLGGRPDLARLDGGRAFSPGSPTTGADDRSLRAREYRLLAERLWNGPLSFARELVRCVAISGSVAFGEPRAGDDLDLFVVTRSDSLWWFLARAYLALWLARRRSPQTISPTVCLNYVLEDTVAATEYSRRHDLLFAREALSVNVLSGDDFYRGLVASSPWMAAELPHLYDVRSADPGCVEPRRAPRLVRFLNSVAFPLLAAYLQLVGLARNSNARRQLRPDAEFRTHTARRRLAFASHRFEELRGLYLGRRTVPGVAERNAGAAPRSVVR